MAFMDRIRKRWNAFMNRAPTKNFMDYGTPYAFKPDRNPYYRRSDRSIVTAIFNRIAMDASAIGLQHVKVDENERYLSTVESGLNDCLNLEANIDQTGRAFLQDAVMSMLDEGCIALCPIDTDDDPDETGSFKIETMRVGRIIEWYPAHVRVDVYNELSGRREEVIFSKRTVAIIENPLYAVVNEPNSTIQRLIRKLSLLDVTDEQTASGKLDMIIQLPYIIKTPARRQQAEERRKEIEKQLSSSKYGIAYADGTEHIVQLNRSLENNLLNQVEYLTKLAFSQIGMTQEILDGTADDKTMLNYYNRTIEPIISAVADELKRKFLTKTARSQNQTITFFINTLNLVPISALADIVDKLTRNEVLTSNEVRQMLGLKPSNDPKADQLVNSNIADTNRNPIAVQEGAEEEEDPDLEADMDNVINQLI